MMLCLYVTTYLNPLTTTAPRRPPAQNTTAPNRPRPLITVTPKRPVWSARRPSARVLGFLVVALVFLVGLILFFDWPIEKKIYYGMAQYIFVGHVRFIAYDRVETRHEFMN